MMKKLIPTALIMLLCASLLASCAPITAEESTKDREYYEEKYADEEMPSARVQSLLDLLDTCVGGQYIYSGQGENITTEFVDKVYELYPDYFSDGRYEYFMGIAEESAEDGWDFPEDYCWDCSGLWWYAVNELGLYANYTDRTASDTYNDYCTPITKDELRPGDIVFLEDVSGRIVHMAVVGRRGYIYEAAGSFIGVVKKRTVDRRVYNNIINGGVVVCDDWNLFGRPKIFE
jgi:NlpC/P60 family.